MDKTKKLFITGDLHGAIELIRFKQDYLKDSIILQLGDAGLIWFNEDSKHLALENKWLNWFEKNISCELFCVLGNHENYERIYKLSEVVRYDAVCYQVKKNIFYVKNGEVLDINNKKFFCLGGASSVDRINRTEFIDWWKEEEMNYSEQTLAVQTLMSELELKVDYILSHTAPSHIVEDYFSCKPDTTSKFLSFVYSNLLEFTHWYFGHFHIDKKVNDKFTCLYKTIEEIKL